jgi:elongator complex protein 2
MLGGSVGANLLGFTGGCISPDGKSLLGIGFGGSFHLWSCNSNDDRREYNDNPRWYPVSFITGHFGSVNDINWSFDGSYLVTTSSDQTCRLFSLLHDRNLWREVSRPQIHGFDMNSLVLISNKTSNYIVSASDEKVLRVFQTPTCVIDGLKKLCNVNVYQDSNSIPRAYIPELGLSNRASALMNEQEIAEQDLRNVSSLDWTKSPLEGQLSDHTVWPEIKKMFGHTDHVMCVAISTNGRYLASACKARNSDTAAILIWDAVSMLNIQRLLAHESTVVCLEFSPDDKYIVSSGKDRILCVFELNIANDKCPYSLCTAVRSAHKRIIWDCSWLVDCTMLATASRDGSCKVWHIDTVDDGEGKQVSKLSCLYIFSPFDGISVTAIDIYHYNDNKLISLAAIGGESGVISTFELSYGGATFKSTINRSISHSAAVKKIKWRPINSNTINECKWLASCGDDYSVRIFKLENE